MSQNSRVGSLSPSETAERVVDMMVEEVDVQRQILEETLAADQNGEILESGRTLCTQPGSIRGPVRRFPMSVDLQRCPVGASGAWHTHVTPDELLRPHNSLPDVASVVFGQMDVIGVVGAETAEYMMAAEDAEAMRSEFRDAVGLEVDSVEGLVEAVDAGGIDFAAARSRLRQRMPRLFRTDTTGFSDLSNQITSRDDPVLASAPEYEAVELMMLSEAPDYAEEMASPGGCARRSARLAEAAEETLSSKLPVDVTETAVGAAIGTVVGRVVENAVFGNA